MVEVMVTREVMVEVEKTTEVTAEVAATREVIEDVGPGGGDDRGVGGGGGGGVDGYRGGGSGDDEGDGGGGGDEGAHVRAGCDDAHDRVEECVDDGPVHGCGFVLNRLRRGARQDNSIDSRVRKSRLQTLHNATVTKARIMQHEHVVVSKDSQSDMPDDDFIPGDADMRGAGHQPGFVEAPTTSAPAMSAPEESGARLTHPESPTRISDIVDALESHCHLTQPTTAVHVEARERAASDGRTIPDGGGNVPPPSTVVCTGAHGALSVAVASIGEVARPPTVDVGLEDGEVACTPTCAHEGEDARPPTVDHVGLAWPTGSLPPTAELLAMESALDGLPDVSALISPTLAFVARPETARADDTDELSRGFHEFASGTILHSGVSGTPAVFHVGAPHAVDQGLTEQVARNHRGGPRVATQRSLGDSLERVFTEYTGGSLCAGSRRRRVIILGRASGRPAPRPATFGVGDAYEERHRRPLRTKTTDVHDTRTTTARLSRARKKGTGSLIPYHRRRPQPTLHARDPTRQIPASVGAVAEGGTGVGGSATILLRSERAHDTLHGSAAETTLGRNGVDRSGRVEKRRGDVVIYHDDSSTAAEAGETTGADDPGDSNYMPRGQAADGDDGIGRRVRQRTRLGPHEQGTPSTPIPPIDRRAQAQSVLAELYHYRYEPLRSHNSHGTAG
ncbi:hypothetical protein CBR_g45206 [Chara braunii]|uniref:Uncharacterized protein n=1 Tax=Chara braunii TaxID=69332 RepID=A0A388K382_CHABU|nr:hypothetical protein CBR_g45206 [Chara braunii]|eukprot:GBG64510.1 hypothetical protein CBR_g45206 [Chara braunii]